MIRGAFTAQRPYLEAVVLFPHIRPRKLLNVRFLVDTGADRSLLVPADYEPFQLSYADFPRFAPADSVGFGGGIEGRIVPAKLILRHVDGRYGQAGIEIEVARRQEGIGGLPSILGRDVLDLFKLTIDRSVNRVELADVEAPENVHAWPDAGGDAP